MRKIVIALVLSFSVVAGTAGPVLVSNPDTAEAAVGDRVCRETTLHSTGWWYYAFGNTACARIAMSDTNTIIGSGSFYSTGFIYTCYPFDTKPHPCAYVRFYGNTYERYGGWAYREYQFWVAYDPH